VVRDFNIGQGDTLVLDMSGFDQTTLATLAAADGNAGELELIDLLTAGVVSLGASKDGDLLIKHSGRPDRAGRHLRQDRPRRPHPGGEVQLRRRLRDLIAAPEDGRRPGRQAAVVHGRLPSPPGPAMIRPFRGVLLPELRWPERRTLRT
jgi:hypothetical protein